ncbi:MAG: hypothetical protein JOZ29_16315 [Deltaproteobacteria bacterium]|nr:hypothetical protein [Deltaproteobacteria bacterium]MBV8453815.1 hypothetical protein [Deltaproteobacteria bacterium]
MLRPILLLEINEVPWRLIDRFTSSLPPVGEFFVSSRTLTNVAIDSGHLSPWVTWPTFHRGMSKEEHGIKNLGQDPSTFRGTPIWQEFVARGHSIGVFGSLQSWPPIDPGPQGFYIPDTFAHDASCVPKAMEPLQSFNLQQTASNGRVVNRNSLWSKESLKLLTRLPRLGISAGTMAQIAAQLVSELADKTRASRRPVFQAILMWDAFRKLFDPLHPPAFATFFTNHVAGVMHRYWHNVFPEDFGGRYAGHPAPYLTTMELALRVTSRILADSMEFCRRNPDLLLVFASSMGQAAIDRSDDHEGIGLELAEFDKLADRLGLDRRCYKQLLAMVPQFAIQIEDQSTRKRTIQAVRSCITVSGKKLFRVEEIGPSLSISIGLPKRSDIEQGYFICGEMRCGWADAGIQVHYVEPGTGYHVKDGAMAIYGRGIQPDSGREPLPTNLAKGLLMDLAGLA